MRSILLAALLILPSLAAAQTPADLARLTGPAGAASVSGQARVAEAGAGSAIDLARLTGVAGAPASESAAPTAQVNGAATGISLANLLAGSASFDAVAALPYTRTAGIDAANR